MEIVLNGCRPSKSWSPLIIHETPAVAANSRNILSFGSRHTTMRSFGSIASEFEIIFSIKANLVFKETYLSNLGLEQPPPLLVLSPTGTCIVSSITRVICPARVLLVITHNKGQQQTFSKKMIISLTKIPAGCQAK